MTGHPTPSEFLEPTELEEALRFERLLVDLTMRFVNTAPDAAGAEIGAALRLLCEGQHLDRSTLWEFDRSPTGNGAELTVFYQIEDAPAVPRTADAKDLFPWVNERMTQGEAVTFARRDELPPEASRDRESFRKYGTRSAVVLPLRAGGRLIGVLSFAMVRRERSWPKHLIERFQLCAQVFAQAIDRQRSDYAVRNLSRRLIRAHEQERSRLARELHDDITQRLALLAIDLARAESAAERSELAETVRSVGMGLARLSEDVHALSYRLHPTLLEDLGLVAAVEKECDRLRQQESLTVDAVLRDVPETIPPDVALCLFRVLQESVRNVARHARARIVEVSLRPVDGGLQLAVRDDGIGFDAPRWHDAGRLGLASMRERLHLVQGELDIDSAPGKGTTVLAWVPLPAASP